jgi:hypothetical protein
LKGGGGESGKNKNLNFLSPFKQVLKIQKYDFS